MPRSKYGNKVCECDGFKFHSKLERDFYLYLKGLKEAKKIHDFSMQITFRLHAGIKYKLDFQIETIAFKYRNIECKGVWTAVAKLKRKLFEADYGPLEIHTAKEPWRL